MFGGLEFVGTECDGVGRAAHPGSIGFVDRSASLFEQPIDFRCDDQCPVTRGSQPAERFVGLFCVLDFNHFGLNDGKFSEPGIPAGDHPGLGILCKVFSEGHEHGLAFACQGPFERPIGPGSAGDGLGDKDPFHRVILGRACESEPVAGLATRNLVFNRHFGHCPWRRTVRALHRRYQTG